MKDTTNKGVGRLKPSNGYDYGSGKVEMPSVKDLNYTIRKPNPSAQKPTFNRKGFS